MEKYKEVSYSSLIRVVEDMNRLAEEGWKSDPMIHNAANNMYSVLMRKEEEEEVNAFAQILGEDSYTSYTIVGDTATMDYSDLGAGTDRKISDLEELKEPTWYLDNSIRNQLTKKWKNQDKFWIPITSQEGLDALNNWLVFKEIPTEIDRRCREIEPYYKEKKVKAVVFCHLDDAGYTACVCTETDCLHPFNVFKLGGALKQWV